MDTREDVQTLSTSVEQPHQVHSSSNKKLWETLALHKQEHILRFYDELSPESKKKLEGQLDTYDLGELTTLVQEYVRNKPCVEIPESMKAVKIFSRHPESEKQKKLYEILEAHGYDLVKAGKVGAFLVAGGQGTRLGYDGPKGEYRVTPIKHKSLFQVFAEQLLSHSKKVGKTIPWYIMTSEANSTETKRFFKENRYFGYNPDDIFFFEQGMMPAFAMDGTLLLGDKDSLALSPDGHGGSLRALKKSGALEDMKCRGVEHLSYFQVDNPLVHCIDYLFLGMHDFMQSEMSSKTLPKAGPLEKVGNFVEMDGKVHVIEYSDMPENLARKTTSDGSLVFNAGSIAIHILKVDFIDRMTSGNIKLPWHRAEKKVAFVDEDGTLIKPDKPNAVKLEQFIFDALPFAENALVFQTEREEEFSPVKNAEGNDSPITCTEHQIARAARWLGEAGIDIPTKDGKPECVLEIESLYANSASEFREKIRTADIRAIPAGSVVYFGTNGIENLHALTKTEFFTIRERLNGVMDSFFGSLGSPSQYFRGA